MASKLQARTTRSHLASIDFMGKSDRSNLTGIICTVGPACDTVELLEKMIESGMTIARLNFTHGNHDQHRKSIEAVREAALNYGRKCGFPVPIAIALDTKGPEIRTGIVEGGGHNEIFLKKGEFVTITSNKDYAKKCTSEHLYVDYDNIVNIVREGSPIYVDDGLIILVVKTRGADSLFCEVEVGGHLLSRKCINLPGTDIDLPSVSERDIAELQFGVETGVDMIFASFVRNTAAIREIRQILGEKGKDMLVLSKIEDHQGLVNLDEIIAESDGIMIARSDLATELSPERVFLAQKSIIARCNIVGKPVICATQMLDSMTKRTRPTRVESSDVANAIIDGADCVQVSAETARGHQPVQVVKMLRKIACDAEFAINHNTEFKDTQTEHSDSAGEDDAVAVAAVNLAYQKSAAAIITSDANLARNLACFKPACPVLIVCDDKLKTCHLQLHRGLKPIYFRGDQGSQTPNSIKTKYAIEFAKYHGFVKDEDIVIIVEKTKDEVIFRSKFIRDGSEL